SGRARTADLVINIHRIRILEFQVKIWLGGRGLEPLLAESEYAIFK
ncbi:MAG: hypothetical protein ACI9XC_000789, partial [Gammaproteobacteria bacterium]